MIPRSEQLNYKYPAKTNHTMKKLLLIAVIIIIIIVLVFFVLPYVAGYSPPKIEVPQLPAGGLGGGGGLR